MANPIEDIVRELVADDGFIGELAKQAGPVLVKADAFTGGVSGQQLVGYNLDSSIKFLYPFLKNVPLVAGTMSSDGTFKYSPIPRIKSRGGTAVHWKTVTAIDTGNMAGGVGRGQRGGSMVMDTNDLSAPFFGLGVEVPVDFETQYEAGDILIPTPLAIAAQTGLRALMIAEEKTVIGGNNTVALGQPSAPTVVDGAATGGSMSQGGSTLSVIVVALTLDGFLRSTVTGGVSGTVTRPNLDGSVLTYGGGSSQPSLAGTLSLTSSHTALVTVPAVSGAVAYAWFWGAVGSETLGAITTITGIELKADATGTQLASALTTDNSKNAYVFDGFISMMAGSTFGASSGSYIKTFAAGSGAGTGAGSVSKGNGLTGDGAGGIVEFDALLKDRWDNYRLGFTRIFINSQEAAKITVAILTSPTGVTSLFRAAMDYSQGLYGGKRVTSYHNKYTGEDLDIIIHPWVPPGTIIFYSDTVPYPLSNVANLIEFETRQGYYQIDWPLATRQWQSGVYVDEALKHFFLPAMSMINNVGG